jgi:hypothetical protein
VQAGATRLAGTVGTKLANAFSLRPFAGWDKVPLKSGLAAVRNVRNTDVRFDNQQHNDRLGFDSIGGANGPPASTI